MKRTRSFSPGLHSAAAARRFATATLSGVERDVLEAVELMVSELATNCIRHAGTGFRVAIGCVEGVIRVEVTDDAGGTPAMRSAGPDDPTGRGLGIVNLLSDTWGVERAITFGKTVWFTLAAGQPGSPATARASGRARRPTPPAGGPATSAAQGHEAPRSGDVLSQVPFGAFAGSRLPRARSHAPTGKPHNGDQQTYALIKTSRRRPFR